MKKTILFLILLLMVAGVSQAATEQAKRAAINKGLGYLAQTQSTSGTEGYWSLSNDGTLAATASAALAFVEEGYLPGNDVVIDTGQRRRQLRRRRWQGGELHLQPGQEAYPSPTKPWATRRTMTIVVTTSAMPGAMARESSLLRPSPSGTSIPRVSLRRRCTLWVRLWVRDTLVGRGAVSTMTYKQVMRDVIDWFSYGQSDPSTGVYRGGWRYTDNYGSSDNSTAQWGSLPSLWKRLGAGHTTVRQE